MATQGEMLRSDNRRALVCSLLMRDTRLSLRQMRHRLAAPDTEGKVHSLGLNPKTGNPWSVDTMRKDYNAIRARGRAALMEGATELIVTQRLIIEQVRIEAFSRGMLALVLACVRLEADLMGLTTETIRVELYEDRRVTLDARVEVSIKTYDEVYDELKNKSAVEVEAWFMDEIGRSAIAP